MARRPVPPDPELAALARDRLARVLGEDAVRPRRAARSAEVARAEDDDGPDGRSVGLDDLEAPRRFTRWHLGVVVAVLLVGLVWGGWSWFRTRPEAVAAPSAVVTASAPAASAPVQSGSVQSGSVPSGSASAAPSDSGSPTVTAGLVVHVLGAVRHPGLVRLVAGARVQDAIKAAGGLRDDADPAELNLAQPLEDGVQVVVGTRSHPEGEVRSSGGTGATASGGGGSSSAGGSSAGGGAVVDLNRANVDQLDALPGVGPVTAQKILDWRQQHGRFTRTDELQEVDGIGPKTYARLLPHVRV